MIEVGKYNTLKISKQGVSGLELTDTEGELIVLPAAFVLDSMKLGDELRVFVYHDNDHKKVATTQTPKITLYGFALLQVASLNKVGAFLNWGVDKDLLLPYNEQRRDIAEGRWYMVYLDIDEAGRLFATNTIEPQLQNINITVKEGDEVAIIVLRKTELGYTVIVNNEHKGLVYENEVFSPLNVGDRLPAYVKKIREDNQLDISLRKTGFRQVIDDNTEAILNALANHDGFLALTDKSDPAAILAELSMSKKAFKKAIGGLYKERIIGIEMDGIRLLKK